MQTIQKQIAKLLKHLEKKPADNQARALLLKLGWTPPAPPAPRKPSLVIKAENLVDRYVAHESTWNGQPAQVWIAKDEAAEQRAGLAPAYVVVKREHFHG